MLDALGQAAFSLSIGMGTLITYGSYIQKKENLPITALQVSAADTLIAVLAGVMIFPAVFAFNIDPAEGFGLVFIVLPNIFAQMVGGHIFSVIFFVLLAIAALTSTVSVLEVVVAYFAEELNMTRGKATVIGAVAISVVGVFATLSFGPLKDMTILGNTLFGLFNELSANILLPLGAILIVLFVGWQMGSRIVKDEIRSQGTVTVWFFTAFMAIVKVVAPIAITLVFLYGLGLVGSKI